MNYVRTRQRSCLEVHYGRGGARRNVSNVKKAVTRSFDWLDPIPAGG